MRECLQEVVLEQAYAFGCGQELCDSKLQLGILTLRVSEPNN